jgi:hypothetical protein
MRWLGDVTQPLGPNSRWDLPCPTFHALSIFAWYTGLKHSISLFIPA